MSDPKRNMCVKDCRIPPPWQWTCDADRSEAKQCSFFKEPEEGGSHCYYQDSRPFDGILCCNLDARHDRQRQPH